MINLKKKILNKKFVFIFSVCFTFFMIIHFSILSYKISYSDHTPDEIERIFKENKKSSHTSVKNNKTDVYIQFTGSDSGASKPIILGYFKFDKKVYIIAASKFQLSSNGGFAIMENYFYSFAVNGEYSDVEVINL